MKIIFHQPVPASAEATKISASGIRPLKMRRAFENCGCEVELVVGNRLERKRKAREVERKLLDGKKFGFLYSECSTLPTLLTENHHIPLSPFFDFRLFKVCKRFGLRIGLFYRDIYWQFSEYTKQIGWLKASYSTAFYRYDLRQYQKYVDRLYLPSHEMGKYIPIVDPGKFDELPPGYTPPPASPSSGDSEYNNQHSELRLLYVGGISSHYQSHVLLDVVSSLPRIRLTFCTRENEWAQMKSEYQSLVARNVSVEHAHGADLNRLYSNHSIASLFLAPHAYRKFAMPFKLFEYLGNGMPVIATCGTRAGRFVKENGIGWSIPYTHSALRGLLVDLLEHPEKVAEARKACIATAKCHTWESRAQKVIDDLAAGL